jgi:EmrB/QacA subfamily drug resistance transporter
VRPNSPAREPNTSEQLAHLPIRAVGNVASSAPRWLIFGIVSMALFLGGMDQTIVATALPAFEHELHTRINWASWTITIYSLGQVLAMPVAGRISDQYGRKKVFILAAVVFTASSLCCAVATNIYTLVLFRALQALGGGSFMPAATGIVSDHFGKDRDRAVGMFASIYPIGGVIGPILGGVFVAEWSWRGIFLINVPLGTLLIVLALSRIPNSRPATASRIDLAGIALLAVVIVTAMFSVAYLGTGGARLYSPAVLSSVAASMGTGWCFWRHSKRRPDAFIPFRLIRGHGFGAMNLINLLYGAAALGLPALTPLYAERRYGLDSLAAGTLLTARAIGMICITGAAVFALRRTGYRLPMMVGLVTIATGVLFLATPPQAMSPYGWLALGAGIVGLGTGIAGPAANNASLQLAPDQVAAIAGLRGMFRQVGSIAAVSVTTAILSRSSDTASAQAGAFLIFAFILVALIPLVFLVPNHRGGW